MNQEWSDTRWLAYIVMWGVVGLLGLVITCAVHDYKKAEILTNNGYEECPVAGSTTTVWKRECTR